MTQPSDAPEAHAWHKLFAMQCNNGAWALAAQMRKDFLARSDTPDWELAFTHAIHAHCAHAAGDRAEHRNSYRQAVAALAAVGDEQDRQIVAETFHQVPAP